ncbi:MAG: hypothetical protein ACK4QW_14585 [Alphaproteobacteria bacterium]
MEERSRSILTLGEAVADFVTRLGSTDVPREVADLLPEVLRTTRYLGEAARRTLLAAGAVHRLDVPSLERLLTGLSRTRRMVDQIAKAEMAFARGFTPPPAGRESLGDTYT